MEDGLLGFPDERRPMTEYPSGYEIGYTQITSTVNITSTNSAAQTVFLTTPSFFFDGGLVMAHFYSTEFDPPTLATDNAMVSHLFEGTNLISVMARAHTQATASGRIDSVTAFYRFQPSAGSHSYTMQAFVTNVTGTPGVRAGVGAVGGFGPTFLRFTKI